MTSPVVKDLEKLVLDAVDFEKVKAGILAGDSAKKVISESIDVAGLAIGVVEGVAEPLAAELCSKNPLLAGLEPVLVAALNPVIEKFIKDQAAALKAKLQA